jgi:hypothetical protein
MMVLTDWAQVVPAQPHYRSPNLASQHYGSQVPMTTQLRKITINYENSDDLTSMSPMTFAIYDSEYLYSRITRQIIAPQ